MAGVITITLVESRHNRVRYLVQAVGLDGPLTANITTTGAATPDLVTNSKRGPVKQCALAVASGLGILAAGAKTQAQSRAIWLANNSDSVLGNSKVPRCAARIKRRAGFGVPSVDADVDGSGNPIIVVFSNLDYEAYLDVEYDGGIAL